MSDPKNESNSGGVPGFQIPMGIKRRKKNIDELLGLHEDLDQGIVLSFFNGMSDDDGEAIGQKLDGLEYGDVADQMRTHAAREVVKNKVREVVRKKAGGGGFVLYSPNQGKKKNPKPVGNFPTKIAAKRAELSRYPPKDPKKLQRLRKEIDRANKDPKKRAEKEKAAAKQKGTDDSAAKAAPAPKTKKEGIEEATCGAVPPTTADPVVVMANKAAKHDKEKKQVTEAVARRIDFMERRILSKIIKESLFREERTGSEWDEYISKISSKALSGDKKFQNLQKNIEKKTEAALYGSLAAIKKALGKNAKVKDYGLKHNAEKGKTYLAFGVTLGEAAIEPMYIYVNAGMPQLEVSDQARANLTKADPDEAKNFRAELATVQERVLDKMDILSSAIEGRDKYLTKVEAEVDGYVAGLSPLQLSLLKQLLVKKYRKLS